MNRMGNHNLILHVWSRIGLMALLLGVLVWSFWSSPAELEDFDLDQVLQSPESVADAANAPISQRDIDASIFDIELWHVPEVVEAVAEQVIPQPAQLNLQLMAITEEPGVEQGAERSAVIYDPDNDRIHRVRVGTKIGSYSVREITGTTVEVGDGRRIATLELDLLEPSP